MQFKGLLLFFCQSWHWPHPNRGIGRPRKGPIWYFKAL